MSQFVVSMKLEGDASNFQAAAKQGKEALADLGKQANASGQELSASLAKASNDALASETTLQASIDRMFSATRQGRSTKQAGADVEAYGQRLDALRAKYNPVFAASKRYEAELTDLNAALKVGAISEQEHATALEAMNVRYTAAAAVTTRLETATGGLTRGLGLNRIGMMEMQAAGINTFQALAAGISPFQVAMMEGSQVVGAFIQGTEGGLAGLVRKVKSGAAGVAGAIAGTIGTIPAIGLGLTAAGMAGYLAFDAIGSSAKSADDILSDFQDRLDAIKKSAPETASAVQAIFDRSEGSNVLIAGVQQTEAELKAGLQRAVSSTAQKVREALGSALGTTGMLRDQSAYSPALSAIHEMRKLGDELSKRQITVRRFRDEIAQIRIDPATPDAVKKIADGLLDSSRDARELESALKATDKAAESLANRFPLLKKGARPGSAADRRNQVDLAGRSGNPDVTDLRRKLIQQQQSGALGALSQAEQALKTANLSNYAKQLAEINFQIDRQIRLNPEMASTWEKVRATQIKALDVSSTVVPLREANEQIEAQARLLAEEAAGLGKNTVAAKEAAYAQQLVNKYIKDGVEVTPQLIAQIDRLAERYGENVEKKMQVERIKKGFDDIRSAGSNAIDSLTGDLARGKFDISGVLQDIEKQFLQMSLANPLKNALYGQNNPTLSDVGGIGGFFSRLLGGGSAAAGPRGTDANPMVVRLAGIGVGGGLADAVKKVLSPDSGSDPWKGLRQAIAGKAPAIPVTSAPLGPANDNLSLFGKAIKSIESSGNYSALGPVLASGDRAYGAYQVMGSNIPSWTKAALGRSLSPGAFLASPSAQDAVFNDRFGGYLSRYGNADDAASAWFTGGPLSRGRNAADVFGTTGSSYVSRFNDALKGMSGSVDHASQAFSAVTRQTLPGLDQAAGKAAGGLGSFGNDLKNFFPSTPAGGGSGGGGFSGNIFSWLFGGGGGTDPWAGLRTVTAAAGGFISGPGTATSDSIPARLSDGEFVVNAAATARNRPVLEAMNRNRFAGGGFVSGTRPGLMPRSSANRNSAATTINIIDRRGADAPAIEQHQHTDADGNKHIDLLIRSTVRDETLTSGRKTNRSLMQMGLHQPMVKR